MNEVQKVNVRRASEWLAGEVEIRIQKKWLVVAAVAVAILVLLALD
jgi:preprotein translocase subunit Sec61beta